jgi:radical SAM protein with 4Fe4S-binding SPASM domain
MLKNPKTAAEEKLFCKKWSQFNCIIDIRDAHNYSGKVAPNTLKKLPKVRYPCYHLWFSPAVNFDGEVSICCCDWAREAVIGNLREDSLAEIWQGNLLRQFRLYHLQAEYNEIPLCRNCDVWSTYPDIFFRWQKAKKKS